MFRAYLLIDPHALSDGKSREGWGGSPEDINLFIKCVGSLKRKDGKTWINFVQNSDVETWTNAAWVNHW
jgi:hypothetical protein